MSDSNEQANDVTELKAHYVYVLIDPRNNADEIFYVGMGQGRRGNQHLQDALKEQENDENTWSEKIRRILAIKKAGSEPRTVVVARFDTPEEAFAVESVFIKWVYGIAQLTNKIHGHGHDYIRKNGDFLSNPDLDIQRRVVVIAGQYTQENHDRIIASGLDVYLTKMKDLIKAYHEDWNISDIALESMNVSFYITVLDIAKIECYLPAKAKYGSPIQIRVRSMTGRPSDNFTELATRLNCKIMNQDRNPYFRLAEDNQNDDLIMRLSVYDNKLQP
jgi:hypothetical protein